jgi:spectinomycin phosphotransferase
MVTEPGDLDRSVLQRLVEDHWELTGAELVYLPVGFGSHHWRAVDLRGSQWFVTADDLEAGQHGPDADSAFAALGRAYRAAAALRDLGGLEFVVSPELDREGEIIRRLGARYAVTVRPFVEGRSSSFGAYESAEDRRAMAQVLGRLHAATGLLPRDLPRADDLAVPSRGALLDALHDLDRPWTSGPFGEPARGLLARSAPDLDRRFREYDELAAEVLETRDSWVITHGEPHRANVVRDSDGRFLLIDWDTTLIAPRERDLRMVLDDELTGWAEYTAVAGAVSLDERALRLCRLWWDLADIAIFVALLRRRHERTEDTAASWEALSSYLQQV